jgi:outer membrane lipoprotein-sorting protein
VTSSRDPDPYSDLIDHDDTLGLNIAADIEAIHAVPIPAHNFDPSAGRAPRPIRLVRHWRPLALAGAAAVLLATVAFIPSTWGGETERASAQEILDRATEQAVAPRSRSGESYHFIATFTVGKGTGHSTETWYADPTHLRTENLSPDGAVFNLAHDGDRSWMYMTTKGGLRAASFPYEPILVDPFAAGSLADVLATYSSDGCQEAVDGGQETVLGRRAYLVRVRPTLDTCEVKPAERVKLEGESGELRVWVDAETFLTLRVEGPL